MNDESNRVPVISKSVKIYCASVAGALFLGIGDLMNNGFSATTLKLGEVFRYIYPGSDLEIGGIIAEQGEPMPEST